MAEEMAVAHVPQHEGLRPAALRHDDSGKQGIVHVIGPELGLTQPGMTIACGDSHTATHGAVGAIAFGIGTSQVRDVLATQCLAMAKPKLRQVRVDGALAKGVYAKDVILAIIRTLGVKGGVGYAYEYAGAVIDRHDDGGAPHRLQHVHRGRRALRLRQPRRRRPSTTCAAGQYAPQGAAFDRAVDLVEERWPPSRSAAFDDVKRIDGAAIEPMVTWGINPGHVGRRERAHPGAGVGARGRAADLPRGAGPHGLRGGPAHQGREDRRGLRRLLHQRRASPICASPPRWPRRARWPSTCGRSIVPGSQQVAKAAEAEGLHEIFQRGGLRVAQGGLLDVPRHERRQAAGPRDERVVQQPQLHRPAGQPHRAHAPDEPGHGRRRRASPAPSPT